VERPSGAHDRHQRLATELYWAMSVPAARHELPISWASGSCRAVREPAAVAVAKVRVRLAKCYRNRQTAVRRTVPKSLPKTVSRTLRSGKEPDSTPIVAEFRQYVISDFRS